MYADDGNESSVAVNHVGAAAAAAGRPFAPDADMQSGSAPKTRATKLPRWKAAIVDSPTWTGRQPADDRSARRHRAARAGVTTTVEADSAKRDRHDDDDQVKSEPASELTGADQNKKARGAPQYQMGGELDGGAKGLVAEAEEKRGEALPLDAPTISKERSDGWVVEASPNGELSNHGRTFTKTSAGKWDCATRGSVGWSVGVHDWHVHIDRLPLSIGISKGDTAPTVRYDLYCGQGDCCIVDTADEEFDYFEDVQAPKEGSIVSVRLDMDAKTLTFGLDGQWHPNPAFTGISDDTWFPYFALQSNGSQFSIVP